MIISGLGIISKKPLRDNKHQVDVDVVEALNPNRK